jgi:hypothetical protein
MIDEINRQFDFIPWPIFSKYFSHKTGGKKSMIFDLQVGSARNEEGLTTPWIFTYCKIPSFPSQDLKRTWIKAEIKNKPLNLCRKPECPGVLYGHEPLLGVRGLASNSN